MTTKIQQDRMAIQRPFIAIGIPRYARNFGEKSAFAAK